LNDDRKEKGDKDEGMGMWRVLLAINCIEKARQSATRDGLARETNAWRSDVYNVHVTVHPRGARPTLVATPLYPQSASTFGACLSAKSTNRRSRLHQDANASLGYYSDGSAASLSDRIAIKRLGHEVDKLGDWNIDP